MDLFEAIEGRRSVRAFQGKAIEQEKLDKILEAATNAPSAGNLQPWEFIVLKSKAQKEKIAAAANNQKFLAEAPVVIVVCADLKRTSSRYGKRGEELYCIQDCANATMNLMLAAHSLGLGTCWVGSINEIAVQQILNLPKHVRPLAIIPVGYADEAPEKRRRLPLESVVHSEKY